MSLNTTTGNTSAITPATEAHPGDAGGCGGPDMPAPTKEHEWLQRFVGEWDAEVQMSMGPGQPPMTMRGTNRARLLGGFWMIEEGRNESMPYAFMLTLGYDPEAKRYIGTWADSMTSYLWKYQGSVDAAGRVLTLETEGPFPANPGKLSKFREVTEFKSADHRVFTSSRLAEDGQWHTHLTVNLRRKK